MIVRIFNGLEKGLFHPCKKTYVMKPSLGQDFIACSHTNFYYSFCHLKNWVEMLLSVFPL